jgi:hypothetical protein
MESRPSFLAALHLLALLMLVLVAVVTFGVSGRAVAATADVAVSGGVLQVASGEYTGVGFDVKVDYLSGTNVYRIEEFGEIDVLAAGGGCSNATADVVECDATSVVQVKLIGGELGDDLRVNSVATGDAVVFDGHEGDDDYHVGNGTLDSWGAAVVGETSPAGGFDDVFVHEEDNVFNDSYTITATTLTRTFFGGLTYGTEHLSLAAGSGNNTISANSGPSALTVSAGDGADIIHVGTTSLSAVPSIRADGGPGSDQAWLHDTAGGSGTYTVSTAVSRAGFSGAFDNGFEFVQLDTSTSNDNVSITATMSGRTLAVNTGSGTDFVNVQASGLGAEPGLLALDGGTPNPGDTLTYDAEGLWATNSGLFIESPGRQDVLHSNFSTVNVINVGPCPDNDKLGGPFGGTPAWVPDGVRDEGVHTGCDFADSNDDNDLRCTDGEELGENLGLGGGRDPLNPWDFADVPTPALPATNAARNGVVSLADAGAALLWVGLVNDGPGAGGRDYDDDVNLNTIEDGAEYDRTGNGQISGPPNGAISLADIGAILAQIGDSCAAAPN